MGNKLTKEIFIERGRAVHGDRYNYDKVVYLGTNKNVEIICKEHGSFFQGAQRHTLGNNCPKCTGRLHTKEKFIEKSKAVHGDTYNYDKVVYINSDTKVEIVCDKHGSFFQRPERHTHGNACPTCSRRKYSHTKESFLAKCKEVHGNKYNYDKVTQSNINAKTKVEIICEKHGSFFPRPYVFLEGSGCKDCGNDSRKYTTDIFIEKSKTVHGNKYNYDKVVYIGSDTKVEIICKEHGSFFQKAQNHIKGNGCPKCLRNRRLRSVEQFIVKAIETHGDRYCYDKVTCADRNTKIEIICRKHGSFFQKVNSHMYGNNCPKCSFESRTKTKDEFLSRAAEVHGGKYNYDKVVYSKIKTKVEIICSKHGSFFQAPNTHLRGSGCNLCGIEATKITAEDFIERSRAIHGNRYNYDKVVYTSSDAKVEIICKKHGSFFQTAKDHMYGNNCQICGKNGAKTKEEFLKLAIEKHGDTYCYDKVNYLNVSTKVKIICKKHGSFYQKPSSHIYGAGCIECGFDKMKHSTDSFIKMSKEIHKDKYNYDKVIYKGANDKVIITCKKHGDFLQAPGSHLRGHKCSMCCHVVSKKEIEWINSFNKNILRNQLLKIKDRHFRPDGYDPITKTIYEFNGDYWHGNPNRYKATDKNRHNKKTFGELYKKTVEKENFLKKNGYNVVSIWESDFESKYEIDKKQRNKNIVLKQKRNNKTKE